MAVKSKEPARRRINLALQGGGVNGAFTWGVLDRLLERDPFDIDGIVGTSAGAINAALLAHGLSQGGPTAARVTLGTFWSGIASLSKMNPMAKVQPMIDANPLLKTALGIQQKLAIQFLSLFSPYQLNPLDYNPMRDMLTRLIDFKALQVQDKVKLFVNATDVESGASRIFSEVEMSVEVIMASSCLPMISHAVQIEGRYYWDGGFSENPPIFPLLYGADATDTLLVVITPRSSKGEPKTMDEILSRLNQITFNASLRHEIRQIKLLEHLRQIGELTPGTLERSHLHMIDAESSIEDKGWQGMVEIDQNVIAALFEKGRTAADAFLDAHLGDIGQRSTIVW